MDKPSTAADVITPVHELVHPDHPLREAVARIRRQKLDILPVVDGDEMVGVLTGRDVAGETTPWDVDLDHAFVRDVMSTDVAFCYETDSLSDVRQIIEQAGHPRLPVLNHQRELLGVVTAADVRAALGDHAESTREGEVQAEQKFEERHTATGGRARGSNPGHHEQVYGERPSLKRES